MQNEAELQPSDVDIASVDIILDVRPLGRATPGIESAVRVPLRELLDNPTDFIADKRESVLVVCDIGLRSMSAAKALAEEGFSNVRSLKGGIDAWRIAGRPVIDDHGLTADQFARFDRHVKLPHVGAAGQQRLLSSTVTVVGAGGLGVPAISYLAAAGIGTIRVIDPDVVNLSNLQRQPAYRVADIGSPKVDAIRQFVKGLTPETTVDGIQDELLNTNAASLVKGSDVIVDATDSFDARYAINDAAVDAGIPLVSGAVYRWEGQLMTILPGGPCYRCVFPDRPGGGIVLDCALTGVLGAVVGVIGTLQAAETLKIVLGNGTQPGGRLLLYDAATTTFDSVALNRRIDCVACSDRPTIG